MVAASDDGVPAAELASGQVDGSDGDTIAAATAPVVTLPSDAKDGDEEDERTIQQAFPPDARQATPRAPAGAPGARPPPVPIPSRQRTVLGLGAPARAASPAAGSPSSPSSGLPLTVPRAIEIREMPDEEPPLEETEVRTIVTSATRLDAARGGNARPAAGVPSAAADRSPEEEEDDDSITTQAPSPAQGLLPEDDEPKTSPADRSIRAIARSASARARGKAQPLDDYDGEESVTTRGPTPVYDDEDGTEGTTQKLRRRSPGAVESSPADEEGESVTTRAPAELTNILRVIASAPAGPDEEDEPPDDSHTAIMPNAPVRLPAMASGPHRIASPPSASGQRPAVDLRESPSDSALRVAAPQHLGAEHASLGAIMAGAAAYRGHGLGAVGDAHASGAAFEHGLSPAAELDLPLVKRPRYGLLVGVVASLSVAVPLVLFLWLQQAAPAASGRAPSVLEPDPVTRVDATRKKAAKPAPDPAPSATPAPVKRGRTRWRLRRR